MTQQQFKQLLASKALELCAQSMKRKSYLMHFGDVTVQYEFSLN